MIFLLYVVVCLIWGVHAFRMQRKYYENNSFKHCMIVAMFNIAFMPVCVIVALHNGNMFSLKQK